MYPLSDFLREELEHYQGIAEDEAHNDHEDLETRTEWTRTYDGYTFILAGTPLIDGMREMMQREMQYYEDRYEGHELHEWRSLMAALGFCRKPPAPRTVVRDLDNPDYTIPYGKNRYCGPTALAYLLRTDPDAAAMVLRQVSRRPSIKGTANHHMLRALALYKLQPVPCDWRNNLITLSQWIKRESPAEDAEYLVNITGHYIVVHGSRWFDSRCHLGKPHAKSPYLRKKVVRAWRIKNPPEGGSGGCTVFPAL